MSETDQDLSFETILSTAQNCIDQANSDYEGAFNCAAKLRGDYSERDIRRVREILNLHHRLRSAQSPVKAEEDNPSSKFRDSIWELSKDIPTEELDTWVDGCLQAELNEIAGDILKVRGLV